MKYRDTWATINLDHLIHNYQVIKKYSNKKLFCVLKANAYGHGAVQTAKVLQSLQAAYVAVSSMDEALSLRNNGYTGPLLILGYVKKENIEQIIQENISVTLTSLAWLHEIQDICIANLTIHIKIDTGMNRYGLKTIQEINEAMHILKKEKVNIEGIFTHYHSADQEDVGASERQKKWFYHIVDQLQYDFKWIHTCNSDATLHIKDERSNAIRIGLLLYGVRSLDIEIDVKPALSLYTKVANVKKIHKNETVGYGATYVAGKEEWIATIPIGYGDGFITRNQGRFVSVLGRPAQIVGKICMDLCMVRLIDSVDLNTHVEIIGPHISVEEMANQLQMIPYEVLCLLNDRIPRVFIKNDKKVEVINLRTDK